MEKVSTPGPWEALPVRFGLLNLALTTLALLYIWRFSERERYDQGLDLVCSLIATVLSVNLQVQLVLSLGGQRRWLRVLLGTALLLCTACLLSYHAKTHVYFDPSVAIEQRDLRLSGAVLKIIASSFDTAPLLLGLVLALGLLSAEYCWASSFPEQPGALWRNAPLVAAAIYALQQNRILAYDEVSEILRTVLRWSAPRRPSVTLPAGQFPLVRSISPLHHEPARPNPKIFLILVESFNANVVEARAPNGLPYTPFFNSLIPQGLYIERFYGNSVQTAKGHFASLCSVVPTITGREFVRMAETNLRCLPTVLKNAGYQTIFFQAYEDVNYDNTAGFLKRNGFELVETVADHKRQEDTDAIWGWGLQDDVFYRRFFEYLDAVHTGTAADKPLFVTLAPISNHMRFDAVPEKARKMYAAPSKPEEHFANSVNIADGGLETFFHELRHRERFRDALVIITGDHSFPIGEHGYYHNETNAYEEFFRIPFLMLAPNQVEPERIRDIPYSQLDIAPTLLEFTGVVPAKSHFLGVSVLAQPRQVHPIPLLQPYSGKYLAVVDFPFKYVFRERDEQTRLFNLLDDPREQHDLAERPELADLKTRLHQLLQMHYLVDLALKQNQVWPPAET